MMAKPSARSPITSKLISDSPVKCILRSCPHAGTRRCEALEECGADYALTRASSSEGYVVVAFANATLAALRKAGLVTEIANDGRTVTIKATTRTKP
jgi:hypothetical protein